MNTTTHLTPFSPRRIICLALLLGAIPLEGIAHDAQAQHFNPNPGVIPPGSTYRGLTYGEWGAIFWTKLFAISVVGGSHPYLSGGAFDGDKGVACLTASGNGATLDIINITVAPVKRGPRALPGLKAVEP